MNPACYDYYLYHLAYDVKKAHSISLSGGFVDVITYPQTKDSLFRSIKAEILETVNATSSVDQPHVISRIEKYFRSYTVDFETENQLFYSNWSYLNAARYAEFQKFVSNVLLECYLNMMDITSFNTPHLKLEFSVITASQHFGRKMFEIDTAIAARSEMEKIAIEEILEENSIEYLSMPRNLIIFFDKIEDYNLFSILVDKRRYEDYDLTLLKNHLRKAIELGIF